MNNDKRDESGRFAPGNPGGPGRPRRAIEREYLAVLGEAVTLDDWRDVVARAVADAKNGDHQARVWLAKYVIGEKSTLLDVAAAEADQRAPEADVIERAAERQFERQQDARLDRLFREAAG